MQPRSIDGRKRPVTACTECRRRKQKCNREKPCNICITRKVTERCIYDYSGSSGPSPHQIEPSLPSPSLTADNENHRSFQDQMGYSRTGEGSTLSGLYGTMGDHTMIQALNPTSVSSLPPSKISHISDLCAKLPPQPVTRRLVEIYFSEANWYFALLEQHYFDKLYNSWYTFSGHRTNECPEDLPRDLLHFPALLFQVLAVALQFAPLDCPFVQALGVHDFYTRDRLSSEFSASGMEVHGILGRDDPSITTAQSDLMRALWLKNSSRGREAWHALGAAIRMAQDLGFHQHSKVFQTPQSTVEETLGQLWYDEYKRRLWVKLFSWDSHMAFTLGRPRAINSSDCTITPPLDRDIPADPATTVPMALFPHEPPSSFTPHLFQYSVCQQIHEAMSLGIHTRHLEEYTLVNILHDRVLSLLNNLPPVHRLANPDTSWDASHPHIPKQRQQISTAASSFLMALHRPHTKVREASRHAAIEAALSTLDAQERLFELMATGYYNIYALSVYTVDAAIFLAVTALEYSPSDPASSRRIHRAIEAAMCRLEMAQGRVSLASAGLQILKLCYLKMQPSPRQLHAPIDSFWQPVQMQIPNSIPSDQTQIGGSSSHLSDEFANLTEFCALPIHDSSQLDIASMFEDITGSNFDLESWVQQISHMNSLE